MDSRRHREKVREKPWSHDPLALKPRGFVDRRRARRLRPHEPEVSAMDGSSLLILRGIVGVVIGIVAFVFPGVTIAALVVIFGINWPRAKERLKTLR
jgi:Flp pilus assembly protein TadB